MGYGCKTQAEVDSMISLNLDWFYTWNDTPNLGTTQVGEFIPMCYSNAGTPNRLTRLPDTLAQLQPEATHLLGFNEPDLQTNMTPAEARAAWPELQKTGLRLGSPAAISPNAPWFDQFLTESKTLQNPDYKIDFLAVHIYQNPHVKTFTDKIDALHDKWGLPVWITETAVADFTAVAGSGVKSTKYTRAEVEQYMKDLWAALKTRPWVERFAWKTRDNADEQMWFSSVFNSNGTRTSTGVVYAGLT